MKSVIYPGSHIGVIGSGQLGRMIALKAASMGYFVHVFSPEEDSPASQVSYNNIIANYDDLQAVRKFARLVDVVTFEFENIPSITAEEMARFTNVRPSWKLLHISQNRIREKKFLNDIGIKTADYKPINNNQDLVDGFFEFGPSLLKTSQFGYDGKGQYKIISRDDLIEIKSEYILEKMVGFTKEISVIVARNPNGEIKCFEPAENIHKNGILDISQIPANIDDKTHKKAIEIVIHIAESIELEGLLAVEMFVDSNQELLVNELAPRPHNSGHWSMDAAYSCQFEQLIRAVCNLPLGDTRSFCKARMKNLIGDDISNIDQYINNPLAKIHIYGKKEARPGRKMGHVNIIED